MSDNSVYKIFSSHTDQFHDHTDTTHHGQPAPVPRAPPRRTRSGPHKPSTISEEEHRANEEFLAGAYAPNTAIAYRSQLRAWVGWCAQRGLSPAGADADSLVTYIRERAEGTVIGGRHHRPAKPNSLNVARAAISKAYEVTGMDDITRHPRVREALRAHRYRMAREGVRVRQAEALTSEGHGRDTGNRTPAQEGTRRDGVRGGGRSQGTHRHRSDRSDAGLHAEAQRGRGREVGPHHVRA